jgi:hypothetical protein
MYNKISQNYKNLVNDYGNETSGKDPRNFTPEQLSDFGFVQKPIMKVIREKCADCCGSDLTKPRNVNAEIMACTAVACPLWLYRTGKNPLNKRELTEEQRQASRDRLNSARNAKK